MNLKRIKETMLEDFQDRYLSLAITEIPSIAAFCGSTIERIGSFHPSE